MKRINEYGESVAPSVQKQKEIMRFALGYRGMNKSRKEAEAFVGRWKRARPRGNFDDFVQAYRFAFSVTGLDMNTAEAEEFAFTWVESFPTLPFSFFIEIYTRNRQQQGRGESKEEILGRLLRNYRLGNTRKEDQEDEYDRYSQDGDPGLRGTGENGREDAHAHCAEGTLPAPRAGATGGKLHGNGPHQDGGG